MARSDDPEKEIWGTWEELLLACAVNRHGTRSWDSVAMEIQTRSPFAHLLTPQTCKQRYLDLHRRYADHQIDDVEDGGADDSTAEIPWLDELRRLRVAELRREVQRYDVSIVSLQSKVKKLKEERERSLQETEAGEEEPDLKEAEEKKDGESPGSTQGNSGGDRISGGDSGRSCKESNSTDPKEEDRKPGEESGKPEKGAGTGGGESDPITGGDEKAAREVSYNGSSETIARGAAAQPNPARPQEIGESGESVAESKRGEAEEEGAKESSDVQSSASLSRRRRGRRRKVVSGSSSGGDEAGADEVSPANRGVSVESQPLMAFLEIIRSHEYGSLFERRLESQENVRYRSMIRQHVDLETVRSKLESGRAYTRLEFFRDLHLLINNAIVFFPKTSPESIAAVHLRDLVAKEMGPTSDKPARSLQPEKEPKPVAEPPPQPAPKLKPDPDLASSLHEKAPSSTPMIACRKRSSISAKAAAAAAAVAKEEEEKEKEKTDLDRKEREIEELSLLKKSTKERSAVSGARGLRTNKNRTGGGIRVMKNPNSTLTPPPPDPKPVSLVEVAAKAERKNGAIASASVPVGKKRSGAATFLNRIKRSSPSLNGAQAETLKGSPSGAVGRGTEPKKGGKGDNRKDQTFRHGPSGVGAKQAAEQSVPVKRSVGRPPKRAAPPPTPPPAKRAREGAEAPASKPPPMPRKRGRR